MVQTPEPFDRMITIHVLFGMTKAEYTKFSDEPFVYSWLVRCHRENLRIEAHKVVIQLDENNPKSHIMTQLDLELSANDLNRFLEQSGELTSHKHFNSIWKQACAGCVTQQGDKKEKNKIECHLKPVEPHGCKCAKHVKAWTEKVVLLRCGTCQTGKDTQKEEEKERDEDEELAMELQASL